MYILEKDDSGICLTEKRSGNSRFLSDEEVQRVLKNVPQLLKTKIIPFSVEKSHRDIMKHEITIEYIRTSFFYIDS